MGHSGRLGGVGTTKLLLAQGVKCFHSCLSTFPTPNLRRPPIRQAKCEALKGCILAMLNGEKYPRVMMTVIRFCVNTDSKELKKLLTLFWEVRAEHTGDCIDIP